MRATRHRNIWKRTERKEKRKKKGKNLKKWKRRRNNQVKTDLKHIRKYVLPMAILSLRESTYTSECASLSNQLYLRNQDEQRQMREDSVNRGGAVGRPDGATNAGRISAGVPQTQPQVVHPSQLQRTGQQNVGLTERVVPGAGQVLDANHRVGPSSWTMQHAKEQSGLPVGRKKKLKPTAAKICTRSVANILKTWKACMAQRIWIKVQTESFCTQT
jgi:hypothetical protein